MARYPELTIELELTDRSVDLVQEAVDVAIRLAEPTDLSLIVRRLGTNRRLIVASPDYLKHYGTPTTPEALGNHNCLRVSTRSKFNEWEFTDAHGTRTVHVKGRFEVNDGDSLHHAVRAGIGIARLATYLIAPDIRAGRLVPILTDYVHQQASIYVVYPHRRHLSPKVRAFVDFLVEKFTPTPPCVGVRDHQGRLTLRIALVLDTQPFQTLVKCGARYAKKLGRPNPFPFSHFEGLQDGLALDMRNAIGKA